MSSYARQAEHTHVRLFASPCRWHFVFSLRRCMDPTYTKTSLLRVLPCTVYFLLCWRPVQWWIIWCVMMSGEWFMLGSTAKVLVAAFSVQGQISVGLQSVFVTASAVLWLCMCFFFGRI
ncbi:unnamed protein product [Ectocarpus fasciculatus]